MGCTPKPSRSLLLLDPTRSKASTRLGVTLARCKTVLGVVLVLVAALICALQLAAPPAHSTGARLKGLRLPQSHAAPDAESTSSNQTVQSVQLIAADASTLGGVQRFNIPIHIDGCLDATLYGFAKCLTVPAGVHWRFLMSWHHTQPRQGNIYTQLGQFGPAANCTVPKFFLATNLSAPRHELKVKYCEGPTNQRLQACAPYQRAGCQPSSCM